MPPGPERPLRFIGADPLRGRLRVETRHPRSEGRLRVEPRHPLRGNCNCPAAGASTPSDSDSGDSVEPRRIGRMRGPRPMR
jgi:hypothetical protein